MYVCHAYIMFINHAFEYIICGVCMEVMNVLLTDALLTDALLTDALLTDVLLIGSLFVRRERR